MREVPRYLLGYGERLTAHIPAPLGGRPSEPAYGLAEAVERLSVAADTAASELEMLPQAACPHDQAVGVLTLHPQAIAKSYFPQQVLAQFGLRHVGSRPIVVEPEKWTRQGHVHPVPSTELFVAGERRAFRRFAAELGALAESAAGSDEFLEAVLGARSRALPGELQRLEGVRAQAPEERVRPLELLRRSAGGLQALEVVLHAADSVQDAFILEGFAEFAAVLGVDARIERCLYAGGLCFVPVLAPVQVVEEMAAFSFLRVTRPVGRMRSIVPTQRAMPAPDLDPAPLPSDGPKLPDFRVAVFDGGLGNEHSFAKWATAHETDGLGAPVDELLEHGHNVTSTVLFGNLTPGEPAVTPYCHVDHFRVLDSDSDSDPFELYDVLGRIQTVLKDRQYEFINLSLGPAVPVEDDEVHAWTAVLDEHLADGRTFATLAVGNTGEGAEPRVQVPGDCVNGVSVGAADSARQGWRRASYSSVGPGRSPGVVKPDLVAFGGTSVESFLVYSQANAPVVARTMGTSFASPLVLRSAVALRAHFGSRLSPLGIKALLVQAADRSSHLDRVDVGWGRLPAHLDDIAVCRDGMVRVIYQGELTPSQYLRAEIPMPSGPIEGMVELRASFCYATPVDPEDPSNYTRAGLEVTFRPHAEKYAKDGAIDPKSASFFKSSQFDPEHTLRQGAQKWETVLHHEQRFRASSLRRPVFDIHYNARSGGAPTGQAKPMRYALVIDVVSPKTPDLYDQVSAAFAGQLEVMVPQIELPVSLRN